MIVQQTSIFKRRVKKMHKTEKLALDKALKEIIKDPSIGGLKIDDLSVIQVFKYKHKTQFSVQKISYKNDVRNHV